MTSWMPTVQTSFDSCTSGTPTAPRRAGQNAVDVHTTAGNDEYTAGAHPSLDELPEVTALDALRANAQLVELLTGRRWHVMRDAREEGVSWSQIGEALGHEQAGRTGLLPAPDRRTGAVRARLR